MEDRFNEAACVVAERLKIILNQVPQSIKDKAQEIRLRINKPIVIETAEGAKFLNKDGFTNSILNSLAMKVTKQDIQESFQNICEYSVYSHQSELKNGYITIKGGHRVGICGTAVLDNNEIKSIRDISSINIRIARQVIGAANEVLTFVNKDFEGILLAGPPSCGKTTVLRDLARQLSYQGENKVVVVDERSEISGTYNGIAQNDLGLCDVLNGYPKAEGIMQAVRVLSPEIIICDEVGGKSEIEAIKESLNTGVKFIASAHASSAPDLMKRPQIKHLLSTGAFSKVILLTGKESPSLISNVYEVGEIYFKNNRINHYNLLRNCNRSC